MTRALLSRAALVGVMAMAGAVPHGLRAQASALVPVLDGAYADLDALVSEGLVRSILVAQRPHSRMAFARFAAEARGRLTADGNGVPLGARFAETLARLEARFAEELMAVCRSPADPCADLSTSAHVTEAAASLAFADAPYRSIRGQYRDADLIDADLNPLLQQNEGRILADGTTGAFEVEVQTRVGSGLTFQFRPRVTLLKPRGGEGGADAEIQVQTLTARAVLGNVAFEVGRTPAFHGQSVRNGPILSANARAMDLVRVSVERPTPLPGFLRVFGPVDLSVFLADMGSARDIPHSKLLVFEMGGRPFEILELGATMMLLQGGEGGPATSFSNHLRDIFLPFLMEDEVSDKVAAVDARLTLPNTGVDVYGDWASTDPYIKRLESLWDEGIWELGMRRHGLGADGRVDLWVEAHRGGVRPHTHHQFTSGLTLDGRVFGDPLGPLAMGWQAGLDWHGPVDRVSVSGAWERYSGDEFRENGLTFGAFRWDKIADNPDEIRLRGLIEWTRQTANIGMSTTGRIGYERVRRFAFSADNRSNVLVELRVGYHW